MGANIPLPALSYRPPEQPSYLDNMGKVLSLRQLLGGQQLQQGQQQLQQQQLQGAQMENQMRAQQMKDSQLFGQAILNSDPTNPESTLQYFVKSGGSGQGAMALQQQLLTRKKTMSDIASADATTGSKNLETLKGTNDLIAGQLHSLRELPDDQLGQAITAATPHLAQLDPKAQVLQQLPQSNDPAKMRQSLQILEHSYLGDSAIAEQVLKASQTEEATQKAAQAKADAQRVGHVPGVDVPYPQPVFEQRKALRQNFGVLTQNDAKDIADAIQSGDQPPTLQGLYRNAGPVRAELARRGVPLASMELDWQATQKYMASLNSTQQVRLRQSIQSAGELLPKVEDLYNQWKQAAPVSGFKIANRAALVAMKNLPGKPGALANALDTQISELTADLGNIYMGGNSPTDQALKLGGKALQSDWGPDAFEEAIKQAKLNIGIRQNSVKFGAPEGLSGGTNYFQQQQAQPSAPQAAPANNDPFAQFGGKLHQ